VWQLLILSSKTVDYEDHAVTSTQNTFMKHIDKKAVLKDFSKKMAKAINQFFIALAGAGYIAASKGVASSEVNYGVEAAFLLYTYLIRKENIPSKK
jgi:hypothetical protein